MDPDEYMYDIIDQSTEPTASQPSHEPTCSQHSSEPNTPQNDDDDNLLPNPEPNNEFVGVNEENLYLRNGTKIGNSHEDVLESNCDKDYEEDDGMVGEDPVPPVISSYDKENPPMAVGTTYPNMDEFK